MRKFYSSIILVIFLSVSGYSQTADFTYQAIGTGFCDGEGVQFTSTSTGATECSWTFGANASPSSADKTCTPTVIFPAGTYNVTLTINGGASSITKQIVINPVPVSCFDTSSPRNGCSPFVVSFDASCSTSGVNYLWDFGDGNTSSIANPSHEFVPLISECFNVRLQVTDNKGCMGFSEKKQYVCSYKHPEVKIRSVGDSVSCTAPFKVDFCADIIQAKGNLAYSWNFSGGAPSTSNVKCPPSVMYANTGKYSVSLTVTDSNGCKSTVNKSNFLSVNNYKTSFISSRKTVCVCESVQFSNPDIDPDHQHKWSVRMVGGGAVTGVSPVPPLMGNTQSITFCKTGKYIITDSVRLSTKEGNCTVSYSDTITVINKPAADFQVVGNTEFCSFPQTVKVSLIGAANPAWKYRWDLGGGVASGNINSPNPGNITFNGCSTFTISLTVTDTVTHCDSVIVKADVININCPLAEYATISAPNKGQFCVDSTATFNAVPGFASYCWKFTPTGTNPAATCSYNTRDVVRKFTTMGCYNVQLIVKDALGCSDTVVNAGNPTENKPICFGNKVKPCFDATPKEVCARDKVSFENCTKCPLPNVNPPACTWCWNFGDGGSAFICQSSVLEPTHLYSDTGCKDVTLISCMYGCCDTLTKDTFVCILPPVASIVVTQNCDSPQYRTFSGAKSVGASTYAWTFPSGTIVPPYTAKDSVVKVFWTLPPSNISYICTLTVSNKNGCTNQATYQVLLRNTHATFSLSDSVGCSPFNFKIKNMATGNPEVTAYVYRKAGCAFSADTLMYKSATYKAPPNRDPASPPFPLLPGEYEVKMIAKDVNICLDSTSKKIIVWGTYPKFSADTTSGCTTLRVNFSNLTDTTCIFSKPPYRYRWKFGDGTISRLKNPTHVYTKQGSFSVTLIVTDGYNCVDSIVMYQFVNIKGSEINFHSTDTTTCLGNSVCFIDDSKGAGLIYDWDFGDGSPHSTISNPCHIYTSSGKYTVTLLLKDADGCTGTLRKTNYITIGQMTGAFRVKEDSSSLCPPLRVQFLNRSKVDIKCAKWMWSFGDNSYSQEENPFHFYTYADSFNVTLIVLDTCLNCSDTIRKKKYIAVGGPYSNPQATPDTGCAPLTVFFDLRPTNSTRFIWNFGDNTGLHDGSETATHTYTDTGIFVVTVIITDSATGNANPCTYVRIVDTIYIVSPMAKFSYKPDIPCANELITFTDSSGSAVGINKWQWYFGDGDSSALQNPVHAYKIGGNYSVMLIATPPGACSDTVIKLIHILDSPDAGFTASADSACPNTLIYFTDISNSSLPITSWNWKFSGLGSSSIPNSSYTYALPGNYADSLIVVNTVGCSDTAIGNTHIFSFAVADAGADMPVCINNITDTLKGSGGVIYLWRPSTGLSDTTIANPEVSPLVNTTYTLYVTDLNGCKDDDTVAITVKPKPQANVSSSDTIICFGEQVTLTASGGVCFEWQPGGSTDQNYVVSPFTTTTYTVIVCNSDGCTDDTTIAVNVFEPYSIDAGNDVDICINDSVSLSVVSKDTMMNFVWQPGKFLSDSTTSSPSASPTVTTTYTVTGTDRNGCTVSDNIVVTVNLLPPVSAGEEAKMCLGSPIKLSASGAVQYDWEPKPSIITGANTANPLVFPTDTAYFYVTGTDSKGCSAKDSVRVNVLKSFKTKVSNDTCVCLGKSVRLSAGDSSGYIYKWFTSQQGGLSETNTCCPLASPTVSSTYTVIVADELRCYNDTQNVEVCIYPSPRVDAGKDEVLLSGTSVKLNAVNLNEPGAGVYTWIPDSTLSCSDCQSPVAHPLVHTTYTVTLADRNGCIAKDSMVVSVSCNEQVFLIPNAFTPNGDGKNDYFMIQAEGVTQFHLTIRNRWGEVVFETKDLKQGWDGKVKGKMADPNVFIYQLEAACSTGEIIQKTGNVTLLR